MNAILINVLLRNMASINFEFVLVSLTHYMQLLHWVDICTMNYLNLSKCETVEVTQSGNARGDAQLQ